MLGEYDGQDEGGEIGGGGQSSDWPNASPVVSPEWPCRKKVGTYSFTFRCIRISDPRRDASGGREPISEVF